MHSQPKEAIGQEAIGLVLLFVSLTLSCWVVYVSDDIWSFLMTAGTSAAAVVFAFLRLSKLSTSLLASSTLTILFVFLFHLGSPQATALVLGSTAFLFLILLYLHKYFKNRTVRGGSNTIAEHSRQE